MATKLEHCKSVNKILQCADDSYFYVNTAGSVRLDRIDDDGVVTQGHSFDAGNYIDTVVVVDNGILLCMVSGADDKYYLYRSIDYGMTFTDDPVFLFGDTDGTIANQISDIRMLRDRSFCKAEIEGSTVLFVGEYNVHADNQDGNYQATDQLRLMKSEVLGITWSEVAHWNETEENTRHIHCVKQHEYTGDIYIAFGDSDTSSGIIRWDGVSSLPDNTAPSAYGSDYDTNGYDSVGGAQRYRVCDFIFYPDYFVAMSDTSSDANERGIWMSSNDMTTYSRVNQEIVNYAGHAGFFGLKTSSGNLYFTEILSGDIADAQMCIWGSSDGGYTWEIVGRYGCRDQNISRSPRCFFERNNKIYLDVYGQADNLTGDFFVELEESGTFTDDIPVNLYPVYYVATDGDNSNDGFSANNAWATLEYAMEGDNLTYGARVRVLEGAYTETKISPDWDTATRAGTGKVVVEGAGKTKSVITIGDTDYAFWVEENETVIFKDLALLPTNSITVGVFFNARANSDIRTINCILGDSTNDVNSLFRLNTGASIEIDRSDLFQKDDAAHYMFSLDAASTLTVKYSVLFGSGIIVRIAAASSINLFQSILSGYATRGVYIDAESCSLNIKNNIFRGKAGSTASIHDKKAHAITDDNIDGNCYVDGMDSVLYVANDGGSHSIDADPLLLSTYKIPKNSPCLNAGVHIEETYGVSDYFGNYVWKKNNIGLDQKTGTPNTGSQQILNLAGGMFG